MDRDQKHSVALSVVTPVYQAQACIEEFHRRMTQAASAITPDYEIIFVNDGSTDQSLEKLVALHAKDPHVMIIDLSRNFGQPNAIRTGLNYAQGEYVFAIDDDLEEQPEWLPRFYQMQAQNGAEVVFSVQHRRRGGWIDRIGGALFFFFMRKILHAESIPNVMTARLMTQSHVRALRQYKEHNASLTILSRIAGCNHAILPLEKASHIHSSYSLYKRWRLMITHITSASSRPLIWPLMLAGTWIAACSAFFVAKALVSGATASPGPIFFDREEVFLTMTGIGFILACLAILGLYLSEMFDDVRQRPLTIIRKIYATQTNKQLPVGE